MDLMPGMIESGIDSITLITSIKGAIRGNHYHKETHQWTYLAKGSTKVVTQDEKGKKTETIEKAGQILYHAPGIKHAFKSLDDTEWIVFTKGPRSGENYESDTFRLEEPLIK